ncbi:MAG: heme biosynthesis HemY N-terminal domain-containing protein [Pseudomonadales bacterium]|nr:heme biosynthesis HemY N-terminal domain-containing protein [Pseudomonadales bacterium]MDP7146193.1 heme biosynthesis HemY N-terminal domain-containing protein [Pseudomonadales bacterium]MDP7360546.1 heme biosynthesis HemY N-terminal domain-containing protein [Pseudomonadales bacterium]MDP7598017.1 heme biosynthesis HemY N-terminal domain-containing protein [Pseudomonadales bacterium]HJN49350.1 heme biosynthesis HemY N-terminal domain-containing protein [Pseudomonadales bacterium]
MKKTLLYIVLTLLLGGGLGTMMNKGPGLVLISYGGTTLQTSLWVMLIALTLSVLLTFVVIRLLRLPFTTGSNLNIWRSDQKRSKARSQTIKGLINLAEGNWLRASRYLSLSAESSDTPLLNYLGAARAVHELDDSVKRDEFLRIAHECTPEAELAIGITQAQLQLSRGQWEQCLATLKRLPAKPYVHKLLKQVYLELKDWQSLWAILPDLRKSKLESAEELERLEKEVAAHLLTELLANGDLKDNSAEIGLAREIWKKLAATSKQDDSLVNLYVQCLFRMGAEDEAERLIKNTMKSDWSDKLVELYGTLSGNDQKSRLKTAESWSKKHQHNAKLMICLGRLSLANNEKGKAKKYFESSLELSKSIDALRELGRLLAQEGDYVSSSEYLQQALDLEEENSAELPVNREPVSLFLPSV